jgi:excisionase family DNA binding protein
MSVERIPLYAPLCDFVRMHTPPGLQKLLVSKRDAAAVLGVSLRTIDNLLACKELRAIKLGRRTLIPMTELARFVQRDHRTRLAGPEVQP